MFTGIISGVGSIVSVQTLGSSSTHGKQLRVACPETFLDDVSLGDSIAINGACMTVTKLEPDIQAFSVDISAESLARTAALDSPGRVNLEKALRAQDRLGGHMVSGHVDGIGTISRFAATGESQELGIIAPDELAKFLAYKGSITVNGVSLTINNVQDGAQGCDIRINLIPHTLSSTTLAGLRVGNRVNLEIDLIARYVERMLARSAGVF
jgi:riboflavin synthase